jgi:hypothetical protein
LASIQSTREREPQSLNRRRALRVLGALAAGAGAAALNAARPEEAHAAATTDTAIWYSATPSQITALTGGTATIEGDNTGNGPGVKGTSAGDVGVRGEGGTGSDSFGVRGSAGGTLTAQVPSFQVGVIGACDSVSGAGVSGSSHAASAFGVWGYADGANGIGVHGESQISSGIGLHGLGGNGGTGVQGTTTTTANGHPAVLGMNGGAGPGVQGFSSGTGSIGISGGSDVGVGFWGTANGSGVGVLGSSISGTGVWGQSQSFFAGVFSGPVLVQGAFTVTGPKSAAVRGADGGLKRMYSLESPESWFEDFGSGQLSGGSATVTLEPGFAAVVKADQYHVFPVANGDCKGLYITSKTPSGFTVHEMQGGTSSVAFDYRVVAKRKDIAGARLEHVDEPPELPDSFKTLPTAPELPVMPTSRQRG